MLTISQRQLNLRTYKYYYTLNIDGIEGTGTINAYKNFQRDNGLVVDGIYGPNTEAKLITCIKWLQSTLNAKGYSLIVDGIVGNNTLNAIKDFQKSKGLVIDGIVGQNTIVALSKVNEPYRCKYFKNSEFACECGCGLNNVVDDVKRIADEIREHFGRPAIITSGSRCYNQNKKDGGIANSPHLHGWAIDIYVQGVSGQDLLAFCKTIVASGRARYTYYITGQACHIDIRI